jgi:hypothetical protein
MTITGFTIQEIADTLKIPYKTAHKRLETAGIKPILKEDLYPESALEAIRNVPPQKADRRSRRTLNNPSLLHLLAALSVPLLPLPSSFGSINKCSIRELISQYKCCINALIFIYFLLCR